MSEFDRWLDTIGLGGYAPLFAEQRVDFDVLAELTEADLKELGLPLGDRKRLRRAVEQRAAEPTGEAERRQVTIVFCDLVDSTMLAGRLDPEELAEVMQAYQACCESVVSRWDGHLAEFLGDGAVVYFGWPVAHENDAARAVHAALELTRAAGDLRTGNVRLSARAGIATGLVVVGDIKSDSLTRREGAVGTTPNLAARVQSLAPPGGVAIASQTRRLIGEQFTLEERPPQMLKGIAEPVEWWLVHGTATGRSRFELPHGAPTRGMIGRDAELAILEEEWTASQRNGGRAVLITGDAGIGKSRLLHALVERTTAGERELITFQCSPFHRHTSLMPFTEWLRRAAGITSDHDTPQSPDAIVAFLERRGIDLDDSVPLLATLLSIPLDGRFVMPRLSPQLQRERTIELLLTLIIGAATDRPLLMLLEDLYWADPTSLELLTRLTMRCTSFPGLIVMTARPGFDSPFPEAGLRRIVLDRLPLSDAQTVVRELAGGYRLAPDVLQSIVGAAGGVPLFVEELTKSLIESGRIRVAGDSYELSSGHASLEIPATLHELLVSRLDSLGSAKSVARVASTLGIRFSRTLLAHVSRASADELDAALGQLCVHGILEAVSDGGNGEQYAFRHALVREAAYQSQLKARRREVHLAAADALERHFPHLASGEPEVLAYHHAEGGHPDTAVRYLLEAAGKAIRVSALREALSHLNRARQLLESCPPSIGRDRLELRVRAALGTTYMQARGWAAPEVEAEYLAAAALSAAAESTAEEIRVLWGTWVYYQVRGRLDDALVAGMHIHGRAERDGSDESLIVADMIGLQMHLYCGDTRASLRCCARFRERYHPERFSSLTEQYSTDLALVCFVHEAIGRWISGDVQAALDLAREARDHALRSAHPYSIAWSHSWGGVVELLAGELDTLAPSLQTGRAIAGEHGYAYVQAMERTIDGWLQGERDSAARGADLIAMGLESFRATGAEIAVPFFRGLQAELLLRAGRARESLDTLATARAQVDAWGERWTEPELYRLQGNALVSVHGTLTDAADASYRRALSLATDAGAWGWRLRSARDYASQLLRAQRGDDARAVLEPVLGHFAGTRMTRDLAGALDVLQRLTTHH